MKSDLGERGRKRKRKRENSSRHRFQIISIYTELELFVSFNSRAITLHINILCERLISMS